MSDALNPVGQALANVHAVRDLQECDGWKWLAAEIEREMRDLTRQVMEDDMAADEREKLILQYRTLKSVVEKPAKTYHGAARVLADQPDLREDQTPPKA